MGAMTPLDMIEDDERRARMRLDAARERYLRGSGGSESYLQELERKWHEAAERLHEAREDHARHGHSD